MVVGPNSTRLRAFVDPTIIVLSMFVVIRHFLRDCVILLTGTESMQILSFGYTCIAIGDPIIRQ
jgi:hypothetical protein